MAVKNAELDRANEIHQIKKKKSLEYKKNLDESLDEIIMLSLQGRQMKGVFIATVGFTHSGKTRLAKRLVATFPQLVKLESRIIHEIINKNFAELDDDHTVEGKAYWLRQAITQELRLRAIKELCKKSFWIINDSANLVRKERAERLSFTQKFGYQTIIIWVKCDEKVLMRRLERSDVNLKKDGKKPTWVDLYKKVQLAHFEKPTFKECDLLIVYEGESDKIKVIDRLSPRRIITYKLV